MKKTKIFLSLIMFGALLVTLVGCGNVASHPVTSNKYTVTFDTNGAIKLQLTNFVLFL